jgi:hypothetical protein
MSDFNIRNQRARNIYQADNIYLAPEKKDHAAAGRKALVLHDYETARVLFGQAVNDDPADLESQYRLSIALLDGRRPHMNSSSTIKSIERRLTLAKQLPEAQVLLVLVGEDYYLTWKHNNTIPSVLVNLINSISLSNAREIIEHVPAEESRVWQLLAARVKRG